MARIVDSRTGLDLIPADECLDLLATKTVGRVAMATDGRVDIFPVNYAVDGGSVLIRTAEGTKWRNGPGAAVAFEIDHVDEEDHSGWSVVVHGRLEPVEPGTKVSVVVEPWAPGTKAHLLLLVVDTITGRRIGPGPDS